MRTSNINRNTKETEIKVSLEIDGEGTYSGELTPRFLNHMIETMTKYSRMNLEIKAKGDDAHHTIEDIGIVIGMAINEALQERKGITRFGFFKVPMDESLASAAIDISGRGKLVLRADLPERISDLDGEMIGHFFEALATNAKITLHLSLDYGENSHHKAEALFKAFGVALLMSTRIDQRNSNEILSIKGTL